MLALTKPIFDIIDDIGRCFVEVFENFRIFTCCSKRCVEQVCKYSVPNRVG